MTHVCIQTRRNLNLVLDAVELWVAPKVASDDKLGEHLILDWVDRVLDNAEDVEPGENGLGELNVLLKWDRWIVSSADWVGGGDNGTPGLEGGDDAGLGDRDRLLLHGLVNGRPVLRTRESVSL